MCQRFPLIVEKAGGIDYDVNPAGSPGQVGHLRGGLPAIQHIQLQGLDDPACGVNLSRRLFQLIRLPGGQKDPRAFFRHGERRRAANRAAAAENHHGLIFKQHEERLMWEWISKVWVKK